MSTGNLSDATLEYLQSKNIQAILDEAMHNVVQVMPADPLLFLEAALRQRTPLRLILVGPPGSGKTTLAKRLAARYGVTHVEAPPAYASKVSAAEAVLPQIAKLHQAGEGWVLDGFPETRADTIQLQTRGVAPQKVLEVQLPQNEVLERAVGDGASGAAILDDAFLRSYRYYEMRRLEVMTAYQSCFVSISGSGSADEVASRVFHEIDAMRLS